MKLKTGILLFLFILTTCSTGLAAENTHVFPDVGTLTFPAEVEVIPYQSKTSAKTVHDLLAKDGEVWRVAQFFFSPPFTGVHRNDLKYNINVIEAALGDVAYRQLRESPDSRLLLNTLIDASTFSDEKLIIKTVVIYSKWVFRTDYYAIDCPEGTRILVMLYPDGDVYFWRPILANVIASIQR